MRRAVVIALEWTCGRLDHIPTWEQVDGRWRHFYGGWGCRLGLSRWAVELDERWATGVWDSALDDPRWEHR